MKVIEFLDEYSAMLESCVDDCKRNSNQSYCRSDIMLCRIKNLLLKYIDTPQELNDLVEYYINNRHHCRGWSRDECNEVYEIDDAFIFQSELFKNNLQLFKEVINYYMKKNLSLYYALDNCNDVFQILPELHEEVKAYQKRRSS